MWEEAQPFELMEIHKTFIVLFQFIDTFPCGVWYLIFRPSKEHLIVFISLFSFFFFHK